MRKTCIHLLIILLFAAISEDILNTYPKKRSRTKSPSSLLDRLEPGKKYYSFNISIIDPVDPHSPVGMKNLSNTEEVIILINKNPFGFHNIIFGNKINIINPWIKKGLNTISLKGRTKKNRKLLVETFSKDSISKKKPNTVIYSNSRISPGNIKKGGAYTFKVQDVRSEKTVLNNKKIPSDKGKIKNDILKILAGLYEDFRKKNIEQIKTRLFPSEKKDDKRINKMLEVLLSKNDITEFNKKKIRFIFGEQVVLVFQGFKNNIYRSPYLFKFKDKNKKESRFNISAQKFVFSSGKWKIWQ